MSAPHNPQQARAVDSQQATNHYNCNNNNNNMITFPLGTPLPSFDNVPGALRLQQLRLLQLHQQQQQQQQQQQPQQQQQQQTPAVNAYATAAALQAQGRNFPQYQAWNHQQIIEEILNMDNAWGMAPVIVNPNSLLIALPLRTCR